jgi:hypothetical protein
MFLDDQQRYDLIACGMATVRKEVSPSDDIRLMAKKLKAINPSLIACKKE